MEHEATGERLTIGQSSQRNQADHTARYEYAGTFVVDKNVLDVACGTGYGCSYLADQGAQSVVGIDIDQAAIDYANANHQRPNVEYVVGSASKIVYPDQHFDVIVTFETIEHLHTEERKQYLSEIRRVLKDDGIILLSTPNKRITSPWSKKPLNKYHVLEFKRADLETELLNARLHIDQWFGQRYVFKIFTYRLPYLLVRLFEKVFRVSFHIYDQADGPEVRSLKGWYEPRYFVLIIKS